MKTFVVTSMAALLATAAYAAEPVGAESFNIDTGFDLSSLDSSNFYDTLTPAAEEEGSVTLFDFTNSFGPLFSDHLIPAFEERHGIRVEYIRGDGAAAIQQLTASRNAGSAAPADVYFVSSGQMGALVENGIMANIPLNTVMPNAEGLDQDLATQTGGFDHGGTFVPFHRNQTAIVYDTRAFETDDVPETLDALLAWAEQNPGRFILTSPAGGGSGSGFLQSVALAKIEGEDCRATLNDFSLTDQEAAEYAAGDCMTPVWEYYTRLLPVSEVTNGNSDTLNLMANGAGAMGTAWEDMAYDFMGRGLLAPSSRVMILEEGQVGGGDGMFLAVGAQHPAAGLLFLDFMVSEEMQLVKLQNNGSRSARTGIDPATSFSEEQLNRLIPTDQFSERALTSLPSPLNNAMRDHVVANLLRLANN